MENRKELCIEDIEECYRICDNLRSYGERWKCRYSCRKRGRPTVTALLVMFR